MNTEVIYLSVSEVIQAWATLMKTSDQIARDNLLHPEKIESAVARPQTYAVYQDADLALQAAALTHAIAEAQAFSDGNKRTSLLCLTGFLLLNRFEIDATEAELAGWVLAFSFRPGDEYNRDPLTVEGFADILRERLLPLVD